MAGARVEKYPAYLTEEFLRNALRKGFKRDDLELIDFSIELASSSGENYCSLIYRAKVNYQLTDDKTGEKREISLILKDMRREFEDDMILKSKEPSMYTDVIPGLETILGGEILAPKLFDVVKMNSDVFVLEDLSPRGFILKDRLKGFDQPDCELVLKKIARFHAASMQLADKFPDAVEKVKENPFANAGTHSGMWETHFSGMFTAASEMLADCDGYESISKKIKALTGSVTGRISELFDSSQCRYKVINHGDFWVNNILFRGDEVALIDLQLSTYSSPAFDIHYFLHTSVPIELLTQKRYDFLRLYFKEFHDTLQKINYHSIPTWEDFVYEMRRMELYVIWTLFLFSSLISKDKDEAEDTNLFSLMEDSFAPKRRAIFEKSSLKEKIKYALDRLNEMGVLD